MPGLHTREPVPLIYPEITEHHNFINVLLIDSHVPDYQTFVDSVNSSTFPIVYSIMSSKTELLTLLQTHFKRITRIGLAFSSNVGNVNMFLDRKPLFEIEPYSENTQFMIDLIKEFNVTNIDYLTCNTLNFPAWQNYYQLLTVNTGIIVGASNDETGNIKYGGDWLMESTGQDIELIYFIKSIEYYTYLLDNLSWSSGYNFDIGGGVFYNNFLYVPNAGTNTIVQTNLDGTIINLEWATGLTYPECGVTYGNDLYVSNTANDGNDTISKISLLDPTIKTLDWVIGLSRPTGLAVYGTDLYVSDFNNNVISKISLLDPTTKTLDWATGLSQPAGLAVFNNDLYVSNLSNDTISKISLLDPTTKTLDWAIGLSQPAGLAVFNNDLYVSNVSNNTISKISLSNPTTKTLDWAIGLSLPVALAVFNNDLYVSNYANQTISQISLLQPYPCFKSDSKILTDKGYIPIQELRKGDLVKTLLHGYKPIDMIGKRDIYHPAISERIKDQLYQCSANKYPEVFEPLVITGCHSILVENSTSVVNAEQIEKVKEVNGGIYLTDDKLRLPACVDERASVYDIVGNYTIYHLALEHEDYFMNYGIYANGLLVETCSKRYLSELSNMSLIE